MLSLPLIIPRDDQTPWYTPSHAPAPAPHTSENDAFQAALDQQAQTQRPNSRSQPQHTQALTPLTKLANDEAVLRTRTLNVRRFGAGWLRPPGVSKTLQAQLDEAAEREEQEMLARREQAMMEYAEAQEREAEMAARAAAGAEEEERDLDEEIPEAEEGGSDDAWGSEESEDSNDDSVADVSDEEEVEGLPGATGEPEGEVTFNEESLIEGSELHTQEDVSRMLEMEEAEMTGALQEERDLDEDIPEAGSYQHTDTELEDTTSEDEDDEMPQTLAQARIVRLGRGPGPLGERRVLTAGQRIDRTRPVTTSSFVEGSSQLESSSIMEHSSPAARGAGARQARDPTTTPGRLHDWRRQQR